MDTLEALVLGLIQGLTEYLPVSSSGHLAIGSAIFDVDPDKNMMFTVLVHVATVLSTLVVLGGQIWKILKGMFSAPAGGQGLAYFNEDQRYVLNIVVSMIPIGIVGLFFKKQVEAIFGNGLPIVGCCLLLTAALLTFSYYARPRQKETISLRDAFIIGISSICRVAWPEPLWQHHRHWSDSRQQEKQHGAIFFPHGHPAHPRRSPSRPQRGA